MHHVVRRPRHEHLRSARPNHQYVSRLISIPSILTPPGNVNLLYDKPNGFFDVVIIIDPYGILWHALVIDNAERRCRIRSAGKRSPTEAYGDLFGMTVFLLSRKWYPGPVDAVTSSHQDGAYYEGNGLEKSQNGSDNAGQGAFNGGTNGEASELNGRH